MSSATAQATTYRRNLVSSTQTALTTIYPAVQPRSAELRNRMAATRVMRTFSFGVLIADVFGGAHPTPPDRKLETQTMLS